MSNIIGYFICEQTSNYEKVNNVKVDDDVVVFDAYIQDWDFNRNRRIYDRASVEAALRSPHLTELMKARTWYGELGHPITTDRQRQMKILEDNACINIISYTTDNKGVRAVIETTHHRNGIITGKEIKRGAIPAFSMRGTGAIEKLPNGMVKVKGRLQILTYDKVLYPSHRSAYMQKILENKEPIMANTINECGGMIALSENYKFTLEKLSDNVKIVEDLLESDSITLNPHGDIIIEGDDMTMAINLEEAAEAEYREILKELRG